MMQNYAKFESNVAWGVQTSSNEMSRISYGNGYWIIDSITNSLRLLIDWFVSIVITISIISAIFLFIYIIISLFRKWTDQTTSEIKKIWDLLILVTKNILKFFKNILLFFWNKKFLSTIIIILLLWIQFIWSVVDWSSRLLKLSKIENWYVWVDLKNENILNPGLHLYSPIKTSFFLSPTNNFNFEIAEITANTSEELWVTLDYRVSFVLNSDKRLEFYKIHWAKSIREVSSDVVMPNLLEVIKWVIKNYSFKDIWSKHNEIKNITIEEANKVLKEIWIELKDLNILDIRLPSTYLKSKEDLLKAENELKLTEAKLESQKKESERKIIEAENNKKVKIIEAEGVAEYNKIISSENITDKMIEMKKLENDTKRINKWDWRVPSSVWDNFNF